MQNDRASPVESVDRALVLLKALQQGEALTVTAAAERLGVVPSTAHRLLGALRHRGFAIQDPSRQYRLGPVALGGEGAEHSMAALQRAAKGSLADLHDSVGETAHLMVLRGSQVMFIDGIECADPLRVAVRIGARMPAYCSAGGKALLACLTDREVHDLHRGELPVWPTRKVTSMAMFIRHLDAVRRYGFGVNVEETEPGVCGVGVTVQGAGGSAVAALTLALPTSRFERHPAEFFAAPLHAAAEQMTRRLTTQPH